MPQAAFPNLAIRRLFRGFQVRRIIVTMISVRHSMMLVAFGLLTGCCASCQAGVIKSEMSVVTTASNLEDSERGQVQGAIAEGFDSQGIVSVSNSFQPLTLGFCHTCKFTLDCKLACRMVFTNDCLPLPPYLEALLKPNNV